MKTLLITTDAAREQRIRAMLLRHKHDVSAAGLDRNLANC